MSDPVLASPPAVDAHLVVTTRCNYACPYCFVPKGVLDFDLRRLEETLIDLRQTCGPWCLHLTGGEPLVHPGILDLLATARDTGHSLCLMTNLSASVPRLEECIRACGLALRKVSATFHPEMTLLEPFVERVDAVVGSLPAAARMNVTTVVREESQAARRSLVQAMRDRGIAVQARLLWRRETDVDRRKPADVSDLRWIEPEVHRGSTCWAGARYVWIDVRGRVYRCPNECFAKRPALGDFAPGLRLPREAQPCASATSCCLIPHQGGLLAGQPTTFPSSAHPSPGPDLV